MNPHVRAPFASLLESRTMCAWTSGAAALHVGLGLAGLGGWPCPVMSATGIPCPGCGLGRAAALMLQGEWRVAVALHAFAPLLLAALALCAASTLVKKDARRRLIDRVAMWEARTAFSAVALAGFLIYWLLRFALDGTAFIQLVSGGTDI